MEKFNEENTKRFIYTGNEKCRKTIESCVDMTQIDEAIDMCNMFGRVVCAILNANDYKYIGPKWNIHRRWCKRTYDVLNAALGELDTLISIRKAYIEEHPVISGTMGFKQ